MSQGLTFSVLRLQEAWGYVLLDIKQRTSSICCGGGVGGGGWGGYICKTTQEICIKYYYLGTSERS